MPERFHGGEESAETEGASFKKMLQNSGNGGEHGDAFSIAAQLRGARPDPDAVARVQEFLDGDDH